MSPQGPQGVGAPALGPMSPQGALGGGVSLSWSHESRGVPRGKGSWDPREGRVPGHSPRRPLRQFGPSCSQPGHQGTGCASR